MDTRYNGPPANEGGDGEIRSLALIANQAYSLLNFRSPLVRALTARGITVYALAPDFDDRTRVAVNALGAEPVDISLERNGLRPWRDLVDIARLIVVLRELRPDATFGYFAKPVIYGSLAARAANVGHRFALVAGLGYVFTSDGGRIPIGRRVLQGIMSILYKVGFAACNQVFFQNDDDLAHFVSKGLLERKKAIRLNGTGVDLEEFAPAPPATGCINFLLMARLLREKGICEYVTAAREIKARYPNVSFTLLGGLETSPGALRRGEVDAWVEAGVIEWPGQVQDVRPWIARASVYVLPSYYREGVPRSTQEAMAMARPVITTDSVGCRETVIDGVNGFLVPIRDPQSLARAMERFIEDPVLVEMMGRESRRLAEERFDVHKINSEILRAMGL